MELLSEEQLQEYVLYWGGRLETLDRPDYRRGRGLAAVTFYCLHHPDYFPSKQFWQRTIKQAVTTIWCWTRSARRCNLATFRTEECLAYFESLIEGYIRIYGELEVFRYRYQNWQVVDCSLMIDQLWTIEQLMSSTS